MKIINLVLADKDEDFLNKISKFILDKKLGFDIAMFSDRSALESYLSDEEVDLFVVDESMVTEAILKAGTVKKRIILASKKQDGFSGMPVVKKFQKSEQFLKEILEIYQGDQTTEEKEEAVGVTIETKSVCFFSPSGGTGNTTLALSFAVNATFSGAQVFFISFEKYNSSRLFLNSDKVIFAEDIENIIHNKDFFDYEKISIMSDKDEKTGITFFSFDINDENFIQHLDALMEIIKNCHIFKYVVLDGGGEDFFRLDLQKYTDKVFVTIAENSFSAQKTDIYLKQNMNSKTHLILNKVHQDVIFSDEILDKYEYLCRIPHVASVSYQKDLESMANSFETYLDSMNSIV